MRITFISILLVSSIWLLGFSLKENEKKSAYIDVQMSLRIRWNKGYPTETWEKARLGLFWGLSHLGATLPENQLNKLVLPIKNSVFELNLNLAGFSENAKTPIASILNTLKNSEEYKTTDGMDLGRFLVLLLHSPQHYYAITGVAPDLETFKLTHGLAEKDDFRVFPVINSSVSKGNRVLYLNCNNHPLSMGFMAQEGKGEVRQGKFKPKHTEVFDIMPNGQLRFAIYNQRGQLENASPKKFSEAGKPSKCQWCHESQVMPLFRITPDVPNFITSAQFLKEIDEFQNKLMQYQDALPTKIIFSDKNNHTLQELLYISFMEPNLQRIALEWNLSETEVLKRLRKLKTHRNEEFKFLGDLYTRKEVDKKSPFKALKVPVSVREETKFDVNFLSE
jgi:hypothetical protein